MHICRHLPAGQQCAGESCLLPVWWEKAKHSDRQIFQGSSKSAWRAWHYSRGKYLFSHHLLGCPCMPPAQLPTGCGQDLAACTLPTPYARLSMKRLRWALAEILLKQPGQG